MFRLARLRQLSNQIHRSLRNWRGVRVFCAVWFTLISVGFPNTLAQLVSNARTTSVSRDCRCSLTKRLSGSCCCVRTGNVLAKKSCCSAGSAIPVRHKSTESRSCCAPATIREDVSSNSQETEFAVSRCGCDPDSSDKSTLTLEPRILVTASAIVIPVTVSIYDAFPTVRVESAMCQPPVPPPKIVL